MDLRNGDCLDKVNGLASLADESIDLILCDLPYAVTANAWDRMLDLDALFKEYLRVIKPNGAIVLFGQQPFTTDLIVAGRKYYRYEWIYEKSQAANFVQAKLRPLKIHENILVFSKAKTVYYPQMTEGKPYSRKAEEPRNASHLRNGIKGIGYENKTSRYPKSILKFKMGKADRGLHTTQKPVALCEYLINTYTTENELVLDNCMGSASTGIACLNTKRRFIGWEMDDTIYKGAVKRIYDHQKKIETNLI
jgi:site-specific DNA-methyltransferase (adenine-specific)